MPRIVAGACVALFLSAGAAPAQRFSPVTPAAAEAPLATPAARSATFGRRYARQGDVVEQRITVKMNLHSVARQGERVVEELDMTMDRVQRREVTAAEVVDGQAIAAVARFVESRKTLNGEPGDADPIAGRTYHCRRQGEQLRVTTPAGDTPPLEEFRLVSESMATLGKPNPLGAFLAGRTVRTGETLNLPPEIAKQLLSFDGEMGAVERFTLRLVAVEQGPAGPAARFEGEIEASGARGAQMRLVVAGPVVIDAATCRTLTAELSGPLGMSESRGGVGMRYQVDATGKIVVAIESQYADAR
ncbi:hypothetical protein Mal64_22330 [Pseudobythopirellula maris]|uniref:Uncharacterized protein n=1 Tax=Pseudobythopirellula maris TaxID=2527991 RepID=A0A5C5ZNT8_9BACT|nr:hypothetical protein [Pseudobythopirellula maris]TWT88745.1 hypothetical protein Mal64_22330 [Pseudobythopirellula maris]